MKSETTDNVTSGKKDILSLLTDSQVVPTSSKVRHTLSSPKNLHYRLLFVSSEMIEENKICGGVINSLVFSECVCAKEGNDCLTGSHKTNKSVNVYPDTVYLAGSSSKNKLTNPKLLDPHVYQHGLTEVKDIPAVLATLDATNEKLGNVASYDEATAIFLDFHENNLINMRKRIYTEVKCSE